MSVYTSTKLTTDHGSRFLAKPTRIVLHHGATTSLSDLIALMMPGGRTVSAHAAIGGREIVNVVPENRRSYSLGSALFERSILSAECVNSTGAPHWRLSDETHESIARWVADVSRRHKIKPHRDGPPSSWTVIGHREVYTIHRKGYATACPGGMRLDSIAKRAQELLGSGTSLAGNGTPISLHEEYPIMKPEIFRSKTRHVAVAPWFVDGHYFIPGKLVVAAERMWEKGSGSSDPVKTEGELNDIVALAKIAAQHYQDTQRVAASNTATAGFTAADRNILTALRDKITAVFK